MKKIYKFYVDCGRMGSLESVFVADDSEIDMIMGKTIYFGEVLGKHSDINITITSDCIELLTDDKTFVDKFVEIMGDGTISGHNPVEYYHEGMFDHSEEDEDE